MSPTPFKEIIKIDSIFNHIVKTIRKTGSISKQPALKCENNVTFLHKYVKLNFLSLLTFA
jgi:hypothetical protein